MKRTVTVSVVTGGFLAITQLLFFWLLPVSSATFPAAYSIYTFLSICHCIVFAVAYLRHGFPTAFAPVAAGSTIALSGMTAILLLGIFSISLRTIVFSGAIAVILYILVSVILLSIADRESPQAVVPEAPVNPYMDNPPASPPLESSVCTLAPHVSSTTSTPNRQGKRRMPYPIKTK